MSFKEKIVKFFERPVEENPIDRAIIEKLPGAENQIGRAHV